MLAKPESFEVEFAAMGTKALVSIVAPRSLGSELGSRAVSMIGCCEQIWSRFLPDSDVSRLNRSNGNQTVVDELTTDLLARAIEGWRSTGGRFSPFLFHEMIRIGYGKSRFKPSGEFDRSPEQASSVVPILPRINTPVTSAGGPIFARDPANPPATIDFANHTVVLEPNFGIDFGGIAKGYTADLVLDMLGKNAEVTAACVSIGGDVAIFGDEENPWQVNVEEPIDRKSIIATGRFLSGGVATSSTQKRTWCGPDGRQRSHIVDPSTGQSAAGSVIASSVAASNCAEAEILAKSFLLAGVTASLDEASELGLDVVLCAVDSNAGQSPGDVHDYLLGNWISVR